MWDVALHLTDPETPLPPPRREAVPDQALLASLQGHYRVADLEVTLSYIEQTLIATLPDDTEIEFKYDSYGDFYSLSRDGLLTPIVDETGTQTFIWSEGSEAFQAERLDL
jgi:hypothetical protein